MFSKKPSTDRFSTMRRSAPETTVRGGYASANSRPHHHRDEALMADVVAIDSADDLSVLEHRNSVGDGKHFRQSVRK